MSELGGLWKHQNNPECTKNVKCIRVVRFSVGHYTVYGRIVCCPRTADGGGGGGGGGCLNECNGLAAVLTHTQSRAYIARDQPLPVNELSVKKTTDRSSHSSTSIDWTTSLHEWVHGWVKNKLKKLNDVNVLDHPSTYPFFPAAVFLAAGTHRGR